MGKEERRRTEGTVGGNINIAPSLGVAGRLLLLLSFPALFL
jgi:hypothetical protein